MAQLGGQKDLARLISRLSKQLDADLPQAQKRAARFMQKRLEQRFKTGGYGEWEAIAESSKASRKERKGGDPPLWDTGDLWKEFSTPHDEGQGATQFTTDRIDAARHNEGRETDDGDDEPVRPFAYLNDDDVTGITKIYQEEMSKQAQNLASFVEGVGAWA